jgi:hypothetical protein
MSSSTNCKTTPHRQQGSQPTNETARECWGLLRFRRAAKQAKYKKKKHEIKKTFCSHFKTGSAATPTAPSPASPPTEAGWINEDICGFLFGIEAVMAK